jgi:protein TorT
MFEVRKSFIAGLMVSCCFAGSAFANWSPYPAEEVIPAFSKTGKSVPVNYIPLTKAEKPWNVCVSFPHMKDPYWLGVDYGVVQESKTLGISMHVVEAGGYTNLDRQISQIEDCVAGGAKAVVIGAISADGLNDLVKQTTAKGIPVIDLVNGMTSPSVSAKSLVSFYTMGYSIGEYLAKQHPAGTPSVKVGWFPGPAGAAWVQDANTGFMAAIQGSALDVLPPKYGDTGEEVQSQLVEDEMQANPDLKYIVGTAVTAKTAEELVRQQNLVGKVGILSFYLTPDVFDGIKQGLIQASPADSMVVQGRIAIDQAVRLIEHKDFIKHVGPKIFILDSSNIGSVDHDNILPPATFSPVFQVN